MKRQSSEVNEVVKIPKLSTFGVSFRKKLKTNNAINALKEFVRTNKLRDVITEYTNAGGNAKELVALMKLFDGKKDLIVANTVFSAVQALVIKSIEELLLIQNNVEEACDELLCNYVSVMHNMLNSSSSTTSHKKVVLKLLTGMVTLSNVLARKILSLFPMSHKLLKLLCDTRSSTSVKLRTHFINYLLSFLMLENSFLTAELLKQKGLLASIIPGLANDHPDIVTLVLNALRTKLVEDVKVSKTLKIYTFNTPCLRSLFKLYDYKTRETKKNKIDDSRDNTYEVTQSVREEVHSLLILLCTSSKKGLLFRERNAIFGKSPNQLIFTLLEEIKTPWKDDLKCQLVTEILKVCPEFLKSVLNDVEPFLLPSPSIDWLNLMNFLEQVIDKQELNSETLNKHNAANTIVTLTFSPTVRKLLRECHDDAIHSHPTIRYRVIKLLELVLSKIKSMLAQCEAIFCTDNIVLFIRNELEQSLNKNMIPCSRLVNAWNVGIQTEINDDARISVPSSNEYYASLANLLLSYHYLSPICFSYIVKNGNTNLVDINYCDDKLRFRRAQLMFHIFNPKPGQDQFSIMLRDFIEYSTEEIVEFEDILENVLLSTSYFDGFEDEIPIWLYAFKNVPRNGRSSLSYVLIDVFEILSRNTKLFMDDITSLADIEDNLAVTDRNFFASNISEYVVDGECEFGYRSKPKILISPMLAALLCGLKGYKKLKRDEIDKKTTKEFVTCILVHSLHLQSHVQGLMTLCDKYNSRFVDFRFINYANFWHRYSQISKPIELPSYENDIFRNVYHSMLSEKLIEPLQIEKTVANSTEIERKLIWNSCLFYTTRFALNGDLNDTKYDIALRYLDCALKTLQTKNAHSCLKSLLSDTVFVDYFQPLRKDENALSQIPMNVVSQFKNDKLPREFSKWLFPYRRKFISSLSNIIENEISDGNVLNLQKQFLFVRMTEKTAARLLKAYVRCSPSRKNCRLFSAVVGCLLGVISINLETALEYEDFSMLITWVVTMVKFADRFGDVVDDLEEKLIAYLKSFPHHLHNIPEAVIEQLLNTNPIVDRLALFLIVYFTEHLPLLASKIKIVGRSMEVEKLFEIAKKVEPDYELAVTSVIYEYYFDNVIDTLVEETTWLNEYVDNVVKIIRIADVDRTSDSFDKNVAKLTRRKLNRCKCAFLRAYFEKADSLADFLSILLAEANRPLLQDEMWLCDEIVDVVESIRETDSEKNVRLSEEFVKQCLKNGLHSPSGELLRVLKTFCRKFLPLDSTIETAATIFQMTISHSQFINVILGDSEAKSELVELLLVLTKKNTSLMSSNHVPLLLGAYKATLSKSDQLLLQVLQWYERNEIRFTDCRPYLWGEAAVTHHSIRTEISVSLKRHPQPNQVLDLFDLNLVKNSIRRFPLDLNLNIDDKIRTIADDVYDPRFFLPLLSHLLAAESRISIQKFTRSGALSLTLASLSSDIEEVRTAGFHCLQRFSTHLVSREKEVHIWDHFVTALKNGIQSRINDKNGAPRLSCIVTTFLAHMSLIISEPLHSLYAPLTDFLLAKPSFDVDTIPNFLVLFYSTDTKSRDHQDWILKIIKEGMRQKQDWIVAQKCFLFKLVSQLYATAVSNETTNVSIFEIIANSCRIKECRSYLISSFGLMSWLTQVALNLPESRKNSLPSIVEILKLTTTTKNCISPMIIALLLLRKFSFKKEERSKAESLLEILSTAYSYDNDNFLKEEDVVMTIESTKSLVDELSYKKLINCIRFRSTIGMEECGDNVIDYVLKIVKRFVCNNR